MTIMASSTLPYASVGAPTPLRPSNSSTRKASSIPIYGPTTTSFTLFHRRQPESTDIFSLGSVLYTVMTGHWPYKSPGLFESGQARMENSDMVDGLFAERRGYFRRSSIWSEGIS